MARESQRATAAGNGEIVRMEGVCKAYDTAKVRGEEELARKLFPNQERFRREEQRRFERSMRIGRAAGPVDFETRKLSVP